MTPAKIIRCAIPDADAGLVEHILWGRTPFPCGLVTARSLYRAARRWQRASDHGLRLCDLCDRIAMSDEWCCEPCRNAIKGALA